MQNEDVFRVHNLRDWVIQYAEATILDIVKPNVNQSISRLITKYTISKD